MTDHYTALGLGSAATLADIKKAFRQKASLYHPDRNTSPDAPARFRAVQEAYDLLSDDAKRQAYDDNRRRNPTGAAQFLKAADQNYHIRRRHAHTALTTVPPASWSCSCRLYP